VSILYSSPKFFLASCQLAPYHSEYFGDKPHNLMFALEMTV